MDTSAVAVPEEDRRVDTSAPRPPRRRRSFRTWRRTRPFWGGVITILAALELYGICAAPTSLLAMQAIAPASAIGIGLLMILLTVTTWRQVQARSITGPAVIILSLASLLLVNLGGWLLGMLLGVTGGSLMFAWTPQPAPPSEEAGNPAEPSDTTPEAPLPA